MVEERRLAQRDQAISRLRSLFEMHHIAFGATGDLGRLLASIYDNRHFAMDFWALVNTLSEDGTGSMSNEELLEALVEGASGTAPEALPAHERQGAERLRQMLAGVDVERPEDKPRSIAEPSAVPSRSRFTEGRFSAAMASVNDDDLHRRRRTIGDALVRLEQSARDLQAQLAEIDAQIAGVRIGTGHTPLLTVPVPLEETPSAMPARWNSLHAAPASPGTPFRETDDEEDDDAEELASPLAEARPPQSATQSKKVRDVVVEPVPSSTSGAAPAETTVAAPVEVFDPIPARALSQRGLALTDPDDDPSIRAPFSSYASEKEDSSKTRLIAAIVILVLLAAGGYAATSTEIGQRWLRKANEAARQTYDAIMGRSDASPTSVVSMATAQPSQPVPQNTPQDAPPATTPAAPQATVTPDTAQSSAPRPTQPDAESAPRPRSPQPFINTGAVRVPSSTMAANLISSRVPAYPESARTLEIEGPVIMDVVISQTGTVRYVRVVEGDSHLRAAAQDAVLRWRYKPYLVNGSPVEVATTVRVDFRLPE